MSDQVLAWVAWVIKDRHVYWFDKEQMAWLEVELGWLLQHDTIKCMGKGNVQPLGIKFVLPVFLVPKKD